MRDLVILGMRRTGTTILFDAFVRDPRFTTYYEPLSAVRTEPLLGGGSGTHQIDLFATVREAREEFLRLDPDVDPACVNHGGPAIPAVELETELPPAVERYLRLVLGRRGPSVTKFVRMTAKVDELHRLAPEAVVAWTVRDPRRVVRSHLHGRGDRTRHRYPTPDDFFSRCTEHDPWSVRRLSDALIARDGLDFGWELSDAERVVLVWAHVVGTLADAVPQRYGTRAVRVRHEDLCTDPVAVLRSVLTPMEGVGDPEVEAWITRTVRPAEPWALADDGRWWEMFDRLGVGSLVRSVGYERPGGD